MVEQIVEQPVDGKDETMRSATLLSDAGRRLET
jgi:hypothetical protein